MKTFLKSLAAAAVGGAAASIAHSQATGNTDPKQLGITAAVGAAIAVAHYLLESPVKPAAAPAGQ